MAEDAKPEVKTGWRYRVGIGFFVVGNLMWLVAMLLPALGIVKGGQAGFIGVMLVSAEVVILLAIPFLGKAGFLALKHKLFRWLVPDAGPISRRRHALGVALLVINSAAIYLAVVLVIWGFFEVTPDNPFPEILGLDFQQQGYTFMGLFVTGELAFIAAIYVLGADWWERFKQLFVWQGDGR